MIVARSRAAASVVALAAAFALLASACRTAAPRPGSPAPAAPASRVVLFSLDGAAALELDRLLAAGKLSGGFARFAKEGRVSHLRPVNPTLTSPNHISLATGFVPTVTGVVSNWFRVLGQPVTRATSGFQAPIGAETLWEAAHRQGKTVGVAGWPGCDGRGPRRTADWGMIWADDRGPLARTRIVDLGRPSWQPAGGALPAEVVSFSPVLRAHLAVAARRGGTLAIADLLAVDRSDDGRTDYDAVWVEGVAAPGVATPGEATPAALLEPGHWATAWLAPIAGRPTGAALKLLGVPGDLADVRVLVGAPYEIDAYGPGYSQALAAQGEAWPEAPDDLLLSRGAAGRDDLETWVEEAQKSARFFVDALLVGVHTQPWDLAMGYMPVIDEAGHALLLTDPRQPGYSPERAARFAAAREEVWQAVDRELGRLLDGLDLQRTTVIVVSDHGMAPVHSSVDANAILLAAGLLAVDRERGALVPESVEAYAHSAGETAHVYLNLAGREPGGVVSPERAEQVLARARAALAGFKVDGERVFATILSHAEAEAWGLGGPNAGDLVAVAAPGFRLRSDRVPGQAVRPAEVYGQHGFPNTMPEMQAIYLEIGPGVGAERGPDLANPDVARRVAARLGIQPPQRRPVAPAS
ncbi:MAG: alkaline phosphatase family protein [Acidobacteriota bacterium]